MSLIQGKQIAAQSITGDRLANNTVTPTQVSSGILVAAGTNPLSADWAVGSHKLTGLTDPTNPQDAATKNYVDSAVQGLDIKPSCRVATAAALPTNTRTGNVLTASANGSINVAGIDGITNLVDGSEGTPEVPVANRILVKNETPAANNGLYYVSSLGSPSTPWTLTRTSDANISAYVTAGLFTFIEEGSSLADTGWELSSNQPITLNTTPLTFTQFSGAGTILAGAGLLKTGSTIDLVIEGTSGGLTANADNLQVNYGAVGNVVTNDAGSASAGTSQLIARADHKHGVSTAAPSVGISGGTTADAGTATSLLRSDARFAVTLGTPVNVGTSNSAGAASNLVGANHVHAVPVNTTGNKNMTASATTSDGDSATATTIAKANALSGYIGVFVNGVGPYLIGDGVKTAVECYISGDGGTTARALSAVAIGDTLRWNGSVAGFQLAATDHISIMMDAF